MQITGRNHLSVDPTTAWAAFHDAGVLERSLPGCQSLREVEPGRYDMTVSAGVAAIKGTYDGQAVFSQEQEPVSFVLSLSGAGGPGTVNADVHVRLTEAADGGTDLDWTADAVVGGPVGGVGQRMLSSVARRLASQFFSNIDRDLASGGSAAAAGPSAPDEDGAAPAAAGTAGGEAGTTSGASSAGAPRVTFTPDPRAAAAVSVGAPLLPMLAGAAIALVGVALGARLRRR
ncbi:hypothetical protein GCM10009584_16650 [Ornithinimicrobium humiphilum]|uniref:Carbon monoxide dehydrogenase subunit G n=1 Tax=Ornithinimicrobium humiphilum TaxID=125288 RepID=A0A543KKZ3_9MICO|nr:carbon monoxide dehydrogenase subunit G [Ornithinimicrobium humiphilum]TQM95758.1 hypothetical protein FB476_0608 [Ornithinimicrobium humiphilum]